MHAPKKTLKKRRCIHVSACASVFSTMMQTRNTLYTYILCAIYFQTSGITALSKDKRRLWLFCSTPPASNAHARGVLLSAFLKSKFMLALKTNASGFFSKDSYAERNSNVCRFFDTELGRGSLEHFREG